MDSLLVLMKTHSLYVPEAGWPALADSARAEWTRPGDNPLARAMDRVFRELGDFHGALYVGGQRFNSHYKSDYRYPVSQEFMGEIQRRHGEATGRILDDGLAYLRIGHFYGGSDLTDHARRIRGVVDSLARRQPKGWILDLRTNIGGNMYPMFCGLAPLFDPADLGGDSRDGENYRSQWALESGSLLMDGYTVLSLPVETSHAPFPGGEHIALLFGRYTASSGEALASSLRSQPGVRSFGEITSGWSTTTGWFPINDSIALVPAVAYFRSPDGTVHRDGVIPDVILIQEPDYATLHADATVTSARAWLLSQLGEPDAGPAPKD